jgi:hypothetical protein
MCWCRVRGSAKVRAFCADGGERNLYFDNGVASSSDAKTDTGIFAEREGDRIKGRVGSPVA